VRIHGADASGEMDGTARPEHSGTPGLLEKEMIEVISKRFESPDETRVFVKGKFEIVKSGGMTIGRASYEPGWKWSEHVSPVAGAALCNVEHVGMVISGRAMAAMEDGSEFELTAGSL